MTTLSIYYHENKNWLFHNKDYYSLIYIDPPFNTGKTQKHANGSYEDNHPDYIQWLYERCMLAKNRLTPNGSMFIHADRREVHYIKTMLDLQVFGKPNFMNEIIWAYDYGGRSKKRWSPKHDTILWYVMDPKNYIFNYDEIDRIPYMAPKLVGPEKVKKGKVPTDVWWNTIVHTNGKEKTGYPTQKPLKILERIVKVHSNPGDECLDFFAGSGSFGEACLKNGRSVTLVDNNKEATDICWERLKKYDTTEGLYFDGGPIVNIETLKMIAKEI